MQTCPSAERLSDLLKSGTDGQQALESHVEECTACQQTLQDLACNQPEWQRWQQMLTAKALPRLNEPPPDFLASLARFLPAPVQEAEARVPEVPGYEILEELGRGATAVVYRARHIELQRIVALKLFAVGPAGSSDRLARFRAEAKAVARLQHPNIVQIYEVGEVKGVPYLALEYLAGGSLAQHLGGIPQPPRHVAALVEVLARAVHFAHEHGIVHRDLKPANILLQKSEIRSQKSEDNNEEGSAFSSESVLKIADFGLARRLEADDETHESARLTQTGAILGTPRYMAPEQARPRADGQEAGPAADIWALGAVLYELLSGRPAFDGATPMQVLLEVLEHEPWPVRQFQPRVPRDLETIAMKCLQKQPHRRYASAQELALDLQRFLTGEPIRARRISEIERFGKWAKRRPAAATALGAILLALVGATLAFFEARVAQQKEVEHGKQIASALDESERSVYFGTIAQARSQWLLNNVPSAEQLLQGCNPQRRGWEWGYLHGLNHADLRTVDSGAPFVNSLAYSGDGRWLASGGGNPFGPEQHGILQLFDARTGLVRWKQTGFTVPVWGVAFSPDGRTLVSSAGNWRDEGQGNVKLWDAATGKLLRELTTLADSPARGVAFSPDGRCIASAHLDHTVRVCDAGSGQEIYRIRHLGGAYAVAFSADGRFLVSGAEDGITFWDAARGKQVQHLRQTGTAFALSPDNRWLVASPRTGFAAKVFDISAVGKNDSEPPLVDMLAGHTGTIRAIAFGPDGQSVATASADSTVRTWTIGTQGAPAVFRGHHGWASAVAFHPEGCSLASGDRRPGAIKMWDLTRPAEYTVAIDFRPDQVDIEALAFNADDSEVVALGLCGHFRIWNAGNGQATKGPLIPSTRAWLVPTVRSVFLESGRKIAMVSRADATRLQIWDIRENRAVSEFTGHTMKVWYIATDQRGQRIASATVGASAGKPVREVKVWQVSTGTVLRSVTAAGERTLALALSPAGDHLAESRQLVGESGARGEVTLSPTVEGDPVVVLAVPSGFVRALTFSGDGSLIAGATDKGSVLIWDTRTGRALHTRPLEAAPGIGDLAFHPDGTRLAGVNREHVQIWDVQSGQSLLLLRGAPQRPSDNGFNPRVAWSHDGTRLAASNWDRTVSVWDRADPTTDAARTMLGKHAASRAFAFHLDHLERHGDTPTLHAERFHRRRIQNVESPSMDLRQRRGDYYARLRAWDKALADFAATGNDALASKALLLLQTGDSAGYQRLLAKALAAPLTSDEGDLEQLIRASVHSPLSPSDARKVVAIARRYRAALPRNPIALDYLGLALLRNGQVAEARQALESALKDRQLPIWVAHSAVGLALVHLRGGKRELAQPYLERTDALLKDQAHLIPGEGIVADAQWDWQRWLEVQLLRREALNVEQALRRTAPPESD